MVRVGCVSAGGYKGAWCVVVGCAADGAPTPESVLGAACCVPTHHSSGGREHGGLMYPKARQGEPNERPRV